MSRAIFTAVLVLLSACTLPRTVDRLQQRCPPPEFGRPGWVRACAGTGAWIGGIAGGVVSIALLPVTYPLSLLCSDGLGEASSEELLFFPVMGGAAAGHFLFGAPPDLVDHVFRRAWFTEPLPENTYELVPMEPPMSPTKAAAAEGPGASAPATGAASTMPAQGR
jgi:hypothetical protein